MKKIDLGQTIAIVANLGVVAGLALLAVEINQSNQQAEANAYQARVTEIQQANQQFALSSDLPAIYVKVQESGLDSLTAEEVIRLVNWEGARVQRLTGQHQQYVRGFLDRSTHDAVVEYAASRKDIWSQLGISIPDASFQTAIDEIYPSVQQTTEREFR